jgi:hypothetical protein
MDAVRFTEVKRLDLDKGLRRRVAQAAVAGL